MGRVKVDQEKLSAFFRSVEIHLAACGEPPASGLNSIAVNVE
jgi:hypothetical protein